jgi:hypothetical protein
MQASKRSALTYWIITGLCGMCSAEQILSGQEIIFFRNAVRYPDG